MDGSAGKAVPDVPGKAFPGGRVRRRAVRRPTKAGVPGGDVNRFLNRDRQSRPKSPATAGQGHDRKGMTDKSVRPTRSSEMEVIRDQFRLYVWAAVGSYRRCDSCGKHAAA